MGLIDKPANGVLVNGVLVKADFIGFKKKTNGCKNSFFVYKTNFGGSHDNNRQFHNFGGSESSGGRVLGRLILERLKPQLLKPH